MADGGYRSASRSRPAGAAASPAGASEAHQRGRQGAGAKTGAAEDRAASGAERHEALERRAAAGTAAYARLLGGRERGPEPVQRASAPNRTGLPDRLKAGMETIANLSLDHVRVHYNSPHPAQLQALAFAQGADIHLAPGQERHLGHEAWHVVQQAQGRVRPTGRLSGGSRVNDDAGLEAEADAMAARALSVRGAAGASPASPPPAPSGLPVQRVVAKQGPHWIVTHRRFTLTFDDESAANQADRALRVGVQQRAIHRANLRAGKNPRTRAALYAREPMDDRTVASDLLTVPSTFGKNVFWGKGLFGASAKKGGGKMPVARLLGPKSGNPRENSGETPLPKDTYTNYSKEIEGSGQAGAILADTSTYLAGTGDPPPASVKLQGIALTAATMLAGTLPIEGHRTRTGDDGKGGRAAVRTARRRAEAGEAKPVSSVFHSDEGNKGGDYLPSRKGGNEDLANALRTHGKDLTDAQLEPFDDFSASSGDEADEEYLAGLPANITNHIVAREVASLSAARDGSTSSSSSAAAAAGAGSANARGRRRAIGRRHAAAAAGPEESDDGEERKEPHPRRREARRTGRRAAAPTRPPVSSDDEPGESEAETRATARGRPRQRPTSHVRAAAPVGRATPAAASMAESESEDEGLEERESESLTRRKSRRLAQQGASAPAGLRAALREPGGEESEDDSGNEAARADEAAAGPKKGNRKRPR